MARMPGYLCCRRWTRMFPRTLLKCTHVRRARFCGRLRHLEFTVPPLPDHRDRGSVNSLRLYPTMPCLAGGLISFGRLGADHDVLAARQP